MTPTLVLAAHGARSADWEGVMASLADRVGRMRRRHRVELGFLELSSPLLADVLAATPEPAVVVPLLLAGGYHVRVDLPAVLARTRPDALVAGPLGPHPLLGSALARRLAAAGLRRHDAVVLGAAGSSDAAALRDVRHTARLLSARLARPVTAAFVSAGRPRLDEALARARVLAPRVAIASCLLAPGFFHDRLIRAGADLVSDPLGADHELAALVWIRFDEAVHEAVETGVARHGRPSPRSPVARRPALTAPTGHSRRTAAPAPG